MQNHNDDTIKTSDTSLKKYTSHFIWKGSCERELETEQNCNILIPTLMAISIVSFSFSRAAQPEAWGPRSLLDAGFLYRIFSPTGLVSKTNWLPVSTEIYNSSIAHSISPHNWPSGCVTSAVLGMAWVRVGMEITVTQFTCHSLPVHQSMTAPLDFHPVPYCQPDSPTPMEYALPPSLQWYVWPGRRSIYNKTVDSNFLSNIE